MTENIFLSIIVPYHAKCGDIRPGISKLLSFLNEKSFRSELLIVSGDQNILYGLPPDTLSGVSVEILTPSRIGASSQSGAYISGFKKARGEWVLLLDADLIPYTSLINKIISEIDNTCDVIRTFRVNFSRQTPLRKVGSWAINTIFNAGSYKKLRDVGSSFSAYRKKIYQNVSDPRFNKYHDFLPFVVVMLAGTGKIKEIPIDIPQTGTESSSYGVAALLRLSFKIITLKISSLGFRPHNN